MAPGSLAPMVQRVIRAAGGGVRVARIEPLRNLIERSLVAERLAATVSSAGGMLAVLLVAVGLFGIVAFAVAQRTKEFGVRMALGARRVSIVTLVAAEMMRTVVVGIGAGALLAWATAHVLASRFFGVAPADALSFLGASVLVIAVTAPAVLWPVYRATALDPLQALREE